MEAQRRSVDTEQEDMNVTLQTEYLMRANGGIRALGWGRMITKFMEHNQTIKLSKDVSFYGKDMVHGIGEGFLFTAQNCPELFNRISKNFFIIRREQIYGAVNYSPAWVQVYGRNGLIVNDVLIPRGCQKILCNGDLLKLTNEICLFQFLDDRDFETVHIPRQVLRKYHVDWYIGKGGQSTVRLLHILDTAGKCAMKIISKDRFADESQYKFEKRLQHMTDEVKAMKVLHHPNIIRFVETVQNHHLLFIIMDLAEGGNLLEYSQKFPNGYLPEYEAKFCCFQIAQGLEHIHSKNIAHRDLKMDNIFVTPAMNGHRRDIILKIGDFGYAKSVDQVLSTQLGTPCYLPPEIQNRHDEPYTLSADIWTLGCLFYACLSGAFPFHETYGRPIHEQISTASLNFDRQELWRHISPTVEPMIRAMIQVSPERRPPIDCILRDWKWFDDQSMLNRVRFIYGSSEHFAQQRRR